MSRSPNRGSFYGAANPDRAADQCQLVTLFGEQSTKFDGFRPYFEIQWGTFPRATFFCPTSIPLPHLHTG